MLGLVWLQITMMCFHFADNLILRQMSDDPDLVIVEKAGQ